MNEKAPAAYAAGVFPPLLPLGKVPEPGTLPNHKRKVDCIMKKKLTSLMLALVLLLSAIGMVNATQTGFNDVPKDAYYFNAVNWAVQEEITQGMGEGLFAPDVTCTRAQVVTFLWRLAGTPTPQPPKFMFTDVAVGSWYDEAVLWAVENKVTDGMGEGIFLPDGTCSRSQIVTFLWKYAGKPSADAQNPFSDVAEDAWYAEAVLWAVDRGITTGLTETTFGPDAPCTRGQIVTFLYRYAGIEDEQPAETEPAETEPVETEPNETEPNETESNETEPAMTDPAETEPAQTEPDSTKPDWGMGEVEF